MPSIHLPDRTCNELEYTTFDFSRFTFLEELEIASDSFKNVSEFVIDGLNYLKLLRIKRNSFTHLKSNETWNSDITNNANRSFSILNCDELELIEIGEYSFCDYSGGFELRNLPRLSTIKMDIYNFCFSSFEINGIIDMILLMNRSSEFIFDCIRQ